MVAWRERLSQYSAGHATIGAVSPIFEEWLGRSHGHGGPHSPGVPCVGRAPPGTRRGFRRRRPLASGPGSGHGPGREGMGCRCLLLRSSHAREGGGGTSESSHLSSRPPRWSR
ncbi:hypothetical protein B5X24_HaOG201583 [Helicoverpa armigera]|nr:hypothetical protein B5X24_HaOG201583 [Helicoverpa armigera]